MLFFTDLGGEPGLPSWNLISAAQTLIVQVL